MLRFSPSLRLLVLGLLTLGLLAIATGPVPSAEQANPNEKDIADLQKQIEALTKKLNDLKMKSGVPTPTPTGDTTLNPDWIKTLNWRALGPASMGGRIVALSVFEADPTTYWVATASGGLLKTSNNGVTFEHQFDKEATVSIGDVCVAPSDSNIVWVGTGENNPRNSVSYGDGVYKSTDGGKTWKNMGLKKSFQVGRIAIHPKDANTVYVGALGRLYGPNEERGLFKTTDGGKTWDKVFYIDDKTGIIDVQMHPTDPNTLVVAAWERQRDGFDSHPGSSPPEGHDGYEPMKKWSMTSGIYKTTDGGKTFKKLTKGLPTCALGRIGLDYYRKDPNTIFAVIDSEKIGGGPPQAAGGDGYLGIQGEDSDAGARLTQITPDGPAAKSGLMAGDIVLAIDAKVVLSYKQMVEHITTHKASDKLAFKIARNREAKEIPVTLGKRPGGPAVNPKRPFMSRLASQPENVQEKQGADGFQYGGIYKSTDGGESWTRINSLNPRPMYFSQVRVDPSDDKHVYVLGIELYRSMDGGKSFRNDAGKGVHADHHAMWINPRDGRHSILGGDGGVYVTHDRTAHWDFHNHFAIGQFYHVCVDNKKPYHVYGGLQDNGSWGGPSQTLRPAGAINEDWYVVGGGDGFVCRVDPTDSDLVYFESQDGNMQRRNLRTGQFKSIRPKGAQPGTYRFNWNTPFVLSSHNPNIFYAAGNVVFRSVKQGEDLRVISPDITRTKRGSGTAVAESPLNADLLYAGTDDGALWVTRDGGTKWTNIAEKVGLPGPRWVATIEASRFGEGRAYVVFDGHRSDDDEPHVYVTEDFGQNWTSLRGNLPTGSTRVLREDVKNPNLLYLGTEFAVWASVDRGKSWQKLNNNLPTVAVHEIAVHPTAGEIVAATHGRSLWALDVTPLRQMTTEVLKAKAHLYEPNTVVRWRTEPTKGSIYGIGSRHFFGSNPPKGAQLFYSLTQKADKVNIKLLDINGKTIKELPGKGEPGLHRVAWDLSGAQTRPPEQPVKGPPRRPDQVPLQAVPSGVYRVVLTVDGIEYTQKVRIEMDPTLPSSVIAEEEEPRPAAADRKDIDD
ncbi:MAG: PDZ domain-containing protein [Gemmataceae bacterium]|nr:PDZ domain-containing protein [Gemmataceae bacterium]